ncbi:MAG: hypothetical protein LBD37_02920 [Treponema sp.]|jgi:hypothetical protein|nr:hypothetical protein [Treponema sp.]
MRNTLFLAAAALVCAALNMALTFLVQKVFGLPLFLDTAFTIGMTWYGGLGWLRARRAIC